MFPLKIAIFSLVSLISQNYLKWNIELLYIIESEILCRFWFLRLYIVIYGIEKVISSQGIPIDIVLSFLLIPKMTKNSVSRGVSGNVPHMIVVFGTHA